MPQLQLDPGFVKPVSASDIAEPGYVPGGSTALPAANNHLLKNGNITCIKPNGCLAFWFTSQVAGAGMPDISCPAVQAQILPEKRAEGVA